MADHAVGDTFSLLVAGTMQRIGIAASLRGSLVAGGEAQRPPPPVHAQALQTAGGEVIASWVRRSRDGWAWLDEMDAPLGEARELYRVSLAGSGGTVEIETATPSALFDAAQVAQAGSGGATLSIRQLGDVATSRAAILPITLT